MEDLIKIDVPTIIHIYRGNKVILDSDLAGLYGTETKKLLQSAKKILIGFLKSLPT